MNTPVPKSTSKSGSSQSSGSSKSASKGHKPMPCPDCDTMLSAEANAEGGVVWTCLNNDCRPIPPFERLTDEMEADMKKPGVNSWNDWLKSQGGKGYSHDQLVDMYHQKQAQLGLDSKFDPTEHFNEGTKEWFGKSKSDLGKSRDERDPGWRERQKAEAYGPVPPTNCTHPQFQPFSLAEVSFEQCKVCTWTRRYSLEADLRIPR